MAPDQTFSAPYDSMTKTITGIVCGLLVAIVLFVRVPFVALVAPIVILMGYIFSPRQYRVSGGALVIDRLAGKTYVPLAIIRDVRAGTPDDFRGCVRLWGSGGFFGYYGLFRTAKLGKCRWFVTDRSKAVIVATAEKTFVLSPDNVEGFIAATHATAAGITPGYLPQLQKGVNLGRVVGFGIVVLVLGLVGLAFLYSPGPPGYTLTADSLTIHDRFYPVTLKAGDIDLDKVRIVDLSREPGWRPVARTNGFGNPHYQSGWFRVANGSTVRLYRAGGSRLVLIPPVGNGPIVLYQAAEPEDFIAEIQREMGKGRQNP